MWSMRHSDPVRLLSDTVAPAASGASGGVVPSTGGAVTPFTYPAIHGR